MEIKCTVNTMCLYHPETHPTPSPQSMEKVSSVKLVPAAKKAGDCCREESFKVLRTFSLSFAYLEKLLLLPSYVKALW